MESLDCRNYLQSIQIPHMYGWSNATFTSRYECFIVIRRVQFQACNQIMMLNKVALNAIRDILDDTDCAGWVYHQPLCAIVQALTSTVRVKAINPVQDNVVGRRFKRLIR